MPHLFIFIPVHFEAGSAVANIVVAGIVHAIPEAPCLAEAGVLRNAADRIGALDGDSGTRLLWGMG